MSDSHAPVDPAPHFRAAASPSGSDIAAGVARPGLVLAILSLGQFMVFLDVSIVNVALPSIEAALGIREANLPYVVTLYGTVLGGFLLFGSRMADTFGRRRVFQIGLAVFGLASLTAGVAQDQAVLFAARGLQGLGSALIAPAALSILTTTFIGGRERAKALGIWGALTGIASVAGVTLGGVLSDGPGWRWIFFINVPVAIVTIALAARVLPESRGPRRRFDVVGAALLTGGLLTVLYALEEVISHGWTDPVVIGSFTVAAALLVAFAIVEKRVSAPLVPLDAFASRTLRYGNLATLFLLGTVVTVFFFASLFLQQVLEYSPLQTGLAYVPLALVVAVGAGLASGLAAKIPGRAILVVGLVFVSSALALLARMPADAGYLTHVLPVFLITGLGMGLSFVPLQIAAQVGVPEERAGLAAGLINTSQEVGGALGVAVAATYAFRRVDELTAAAAGDPSLVEAARLSVFHDGFAVGGALSIAALLVTLVLLPAIPKHEGPVVP
ncbi:MAG: MFS transporter [Geodermatophilaceae bacterium]|nr:MFS transporter [Geodermatophilaceae bacterium]